MKRLLTYLGILGLALGLVACEQNTIAALVSTLGNATAALASIQGNAALAAKIKADTEQASADVLAWKEGTSSQMAAQAIHIVESDIGLICSSIPGQPGADCQKYEPLILLAVGTADAILSILEHRQALPNARVMGAPRNSKDFKARWNGIVAGDPALARAKL